MSLVVLRLLFDFGLVILIWLVQVIIYPGFSYYRKENLLVWHRLYTPRIGFVVMPLMLGQLFLGIFRCYQEANIYHIINLVLVFGVWVSTFLQFVPLHHRISKGEVDNRIIDKLIHLNWLRTFLWTLIFLHNLYLYVL